MAVMLADIWLAYERTYVDRLAPKTRAEYRGAWKHAQKLGERPDAATVERWRAELAERYSVAYTNFLLRVLHTAVRRGGPLAGADLELTAGILAVSALREDTLEPRCPPPDFRERALLAARNRGERAWLRLIGEAGLRVGEMEGLRFEDLDIAAGVLHVVRQRDADRRKNRRRHAVTLDPELVADLVWVHQHRAELRPRQGWHRGKADGYLWPWGKKYLAAFLERIRRSFGTERDLYLPRGLGWHAWRHAGASELAAAGESDQAIAEWLGDKDTSMAARYSARLRGATHARLTTCRKPAQRMTAEVAHRPRSSAAGGLSPTSCTGGMALQVQWVTNGDFSDGTEPQHSATPGRRRSGERW